jgi:hypothetical protein
MARGGRPYLHPLTIETITPAERKNRQLHFASALPVSLFNRSLPKSSEMLDNCPTL